nr:MAG: hypothetical protein 1 [Leviviridae sp.]
MDDVAPGDNHVFRVRRVDATNPPNLTGHDLDRVRYSTWPVANATGGQWSSEETLIGVKPDGVYAAELLARTNPSRPVVDVPAFLGELGDFPKLFKIAGENAIRTVARGNLAFWFGWKPMVQDLYKMMQFSTVANARAKELKELYTKGLSCTRSLDSISASSSTGSFQATAYDTVKTTRMSNAEIWGHCKWKPTSVPPSTEQGMINLAMRAAYGLTLDPATAWELIPFSWMIDWFTSVGDYLNSQRNTVGAAPYDISIMRKTTTTHGFSKGTWPSTNLNLQGGPIKYEQKLRVPASASLDAYLPYLSMQQLSILGSLWILGAGASWSRGRRG